MSKGAQQAGNTTSTQMPAQYLLPDISRSLGQANSILTQGQQYYPGQTIAGFSQPQEQAFGKISALGMNGDSSLNKTMRFDNMMLQGGGSNPWLDKTFNQAADATQNRLSSEFAGSGQDVGAGAALRGNQLNNLATDIYGGNYQNTLQNALQAGNQSQSVYNTELGGAQQALGVGNQVQQQGQNLINSDMQRYNFYQNLPQQMLSQFNQNISATQPGMQQQSPYFSNKGANTLGSALAMQQLYQGYKGKGSSGGDSAGGEFSSGPGGFFSGGG